MNGISCSNALTLLLKYFTDNVRQWQNKNPIEWKILQTEYPDLRIIHDTNYISIYDDYRPLFKFIIEKGCESINLGYQLYKLWPERIVMHDNYLYLDFYHAPSDMNLIHHQTNLFNTVLNMINIEFEYMAPRFIIEYNTKNKTFSLLSYRI